MRLESKTVMLAVALVGLAFAVQPAAAAHGKTVGIIGDSVATGAVSSHNVDARVLSLLINFIRHGGYRDPEASQGGVNYPENAFSQLTATGFGVKPSNIVNVATNGQRVDSIATQFQKLQKIVSTFPDYMFLSFTANDACSEEIFSTSVDAFRAGYLTRLLDGNNGQGGMRYMTRFAPTDRDTSVFLLAPLNFPQVLTNPKILEREVPLHFSTVRCERFRTGNHAEGPRISYLADKLKQMCPAVLGTNPKSMDDDSIFRRKHLVLIHEAMVQAQEAAIATLRSENKNSRLKLRFISSPSRISFDSRHVANDCFHLSNQGQGVLGLTAWAEIFDGI